MSPTSGLQGAQAGVHPVDQEYLEPETAHLPALGAQQGQAGCSQSRGPWGRPCLPTEAAAGVSQPGGLTVLWFYFNSALGKCISFPVELHVLVAKNIVFFHLIQT